MKYIKQLDSIRAIAVLLVIVSHWFPEKNILNILPNGNLGVDIFFVLSGFLITTILLNNKIKKDNAETTLSRVLRNFYWR
jgi:peptidoglycan/LPS O-acetylase OafA/YrhL